MYRVLIVDDKALIRKGIMASIDWNGLGLELMGEAENGEHALNSVKKDNPDIVITDIRMPDMDGLELLKNISELDNQIVRIVISGYDDFEYAKKAIKYGSIDYIMKPINPSELNESLRKACSILDKSKMYAPKNEQLLKDFFQKLFKEINFNQQENRFLYKEYNLGDSLFCVTVIKDKTVNAELIKKLGPPCNLRICSLEEGNGITTCVIMADKKGWSIRSFELAVNKYFSQFAADFGKDNILVGIGEAIENLDELIKSYKTACDAALCCMIPGSEQIMSYSQMINRKPLNIRIDEYGSQLMINVSSGNASKVTQILDGLFEKVLSTPESSMENIRLLIINLCHILIKMNVDFESEIYNFLDKIGKPEQFLKYESIHSLTQIVYNFYNFATQKNLEQTGGKNSVVAKAKSLIERNFSEDISLNKLSNLFHINASYLTRIFKEEEGYSINEYIVKVRVENAKRILEAGKVNIQKLAETVGYEDSTYFFKVFKKVTGMTPREYLSKNTKK